MKENHITAIRNTVIKGFNIDEGPCIKSIQMCLNDIGVCHQRYYGGIFVGNHVHAMLKVYNSANSNIYLLILHFSRPMWKLCVLVL